MTKQFLNLKGFDPYNMGARIEINEETDEIHPEIICTLYVGENIEGGLIGLTIEQVREIRDCCNRILGEVKQ